MFLFVLAMCFSPFSYVFLRRHWLRHLLCVRMRLFPVHTTVRIRPRPKNKPAFQPVSPPFARYTRVPVSFSRPIAHRIRTRRRTYSTEVTSSLSNLPLHRIIRPCSRTRAQLIYQDARPVSREISKNEKIFRPPPDMRKTQAAAAGFRGGRSESPPYL